MLLLGLEVTGLLLLHPFLGLPLFSAFLFLVRVVSRRNFQDLLHNQVVVLKNVLLSLLERGQSAEDTVEQFGIDPNFGHSCSLRPLLIAFLEALVDCLKELVVNKVAIFVQRLLGVIRAEEQIYLQAPDLSMWVLGLVDVNIRLELLSKGGEEF